MDTSDCRGITFLLSLSLVPIACFRDEGIATAGDASGASGTSGTSGTGGSGGSGGTTGTTGWQGSGSTFGGEGAALCAALGQQDLVCNFMSSSVLTCQEVLDDAGDTSPECLARVEAWLMCLTDASCASREEGAACLDQGVKVVEGCAPEVMPPCVSLAVKVATCEVALDLVETAGECQYQLEYAAYYGAECVKATEEHFACLMTLSCALIVAGTGCEESAAALALACD